MNEENVMTTNEQEERMPFFRIPKAILTDEKYASLSEGAMLLYGILLDRKSLSERNDWRDKKQAKKISEENKRTKTSE